MDEIGTNMERFPSAPQLASWAGICPGNNESAGKHLPAKGSKWLRITLTESAQTAARTKNTYFASRYARIKGRRGHKEAIVAVAHAILVTVYHMLRTGRTYADLGPDYLLQRHAADAYRNRLVHQLQRLGFAVSLTPVAA